MTSFSVVVPTYRNVSGVKDIFESLQAQSMTGLLSDIVVVVDKSELEQEDYQNLFEQFSSLPITPIWNDQNLGSFETRKRGLLAAKAPYVIGIDDDVILEADFLESYNSGVEKFGEKAVFCGEIRPLHPTSAFEKYLTTTSTYFGHHGLQHLTECPFHKLYMGNFCVPRRAILSASLENPIHLGKGNKAYGYPEMLFAYELSRSGYRFYFQKKASVLHNDVPSLQGFLEKKYRAGMAAPGIVAVRPELKKLVHYSPLWRFFPLQSLPSSEVLAFFGHLCSKIYKLTGITKPFKLLLGIAFFAGMSRGIRVRSSEA